MYARVRPYLLFWIVGLAAFSADIATKTWVVRHIPFGTYFAGDTERAPIIIFDWFWLVHVGNKGAAWGLGAEHDLRPFLIILALVVVSLVWLWRKALLRELQGGQIAFGLFVGGTLGNVHDRVVSHHVIDFIDVHLPYYRFPAFNVADSCICVGVGLYIIMSYRQERLLREAITSQNGEDCPTDKGS